LSSKEAAVSVSLFWILWFNFLC